MLYGLPVIRVRGSDFLGIQATIKMDNSLHIYCQESIIDTPTLLRIYQSICSEEDFENPFFSLNNKMLYQLSSIVRIKEHYYFRFSFLSNISQNNYEDVKMTKHTFIVFKKMLEIHLGDLIHEKI